MKPQKIGKAYDQITHLWENEEFDRSNGMEQHERALTFVDEKKTALDVGCGCSGRILDFFTGNGFTPDAVDISKKMIELAKEKHPHVEFFNEDICEWEPPRSYDFISAWDSIWHVPLSQQELVISKLASKLTKNGVLIFSCGGTDVPGEHRDDYMGPEVYYSSLGVSGYLALFDDLDCICRHLEYDQHPELHTYFIVQKISSGS